MRRARKRRPVSRRGGRKKTRNVQAERENIGTRQKAPIEGESASAIDDEDRRKQSTHLSGRISRTRSITGPPSTRPQSTRDNRAHELGAYEANSLWEAARVRRETMAYLEGEGNERNDSRPGGHTDERSQTTRRALKPNASSKKSQIAN